MNACPWCGYDATGRDLIPRALTRVRRLLLVSRIRDWGYRVLLRPGISGVDPALSQGRGDRAALRGRQAGGRTRSPGPCWSGLITHELGHSFLYHHWDWTRSRRFRRAFGEVDKAYRGMDNTWVYFQRRRVAIAPRDFVSAYAAKHPQEDFAETFRFYVTRRGRLRDLFARVRAEAEGRDPVREVPGAARFRAGAAGVGMRAEGRRGGRTDGRKDGGCVPPLSSRAERGIYSAESNPVGRSTRPGRPALRSVSAISALGSPSLRLSTPPSPRSAR